MASEKTKERNEKFKDYKQTRLPVDKDGNTDFSKLRMPSRRATRRGNSPRHFMLRRVEKYGKETDAWSWKATQVAPMIKRAKNRIANKRARAARKHNR